MPNAAVALLLSCLLASSAVPLARAATAPPAKERRELAPMPTRTLELAQKISALWQGNKYLYCDPRSSIEATVTEIRKLHEVKTAAFDPKNAEIRYETRQGTRGTVDVEIYPLKQRGHCLD